MSEPSTTVSPRPRLAAHRVALTIGFAALVGLCWSGTLEDAARNGINGTLQRALVTAAVARGLNGVISVAQGTEIAIQPVGVGVTITAGQILDPLNDLVERFSWLALAASASLGVQMLLSEIFAEPAVNWLVTAAVGLYLLLLWWPGPLQDLDWLFRVAALTIFVRFVFTFITLTVGLVDQWVLEERQATAMAELTSASRQIQALEQTDVSIDPEASILERFESVIDTSRGAFDIEARLSALHTRVEAAITHLIDLIILFLVQTLVLPLGAIYLATASFRGFWQWSRSQSANRPMYQR